MIEENKPNDGDSQRALSDGSGALDLTQPDDDLVAVQNARREKRARRRDLRLVERTGGGPDPEMGQPLPQPGESQPRAEPQHAARRTPRNDLQRPRAPLAEKSRAPQVEFDEAGLDGKGLDNASTTTSEEQQESLGASETLLLDTGGKSLTRTTARARKKQQAAAAAVDAAEDNPALGALNRHLNMMMQQLTAAHRVIGRVAAERDALRQQLADLQGIPVEEIVVSSIGVSSEVSPRPASATTATDAQNTSLLSRLNYFGGDDVTLMRKRRQTFVLALAVVGSIIAVAARQIGWSMPEDISRESLAALPVLGNLMTVFLAGWVLFRIIRVGSKGVRWVFPSEDRRRRRR